MILFPHLRTHRIAVRLRELTLADAIAVCKIPAERHELTTTEFLRFVARDAEKPQDRYITDPRLLTVEERTLLVCHYLSQVSDDGPDFSIGSEGRLSDYVVFDADIKTEQVDLGEIGGKRLVMRPLLGLHAEVLERCCSTGGDWLIGAMGCQISEAGEALPDWSALSDIQALEWVKARIDAVRALGESEFEDRLAVYTDGRAAMHHFFTPNFDAAGLVYEPNEREDEQEAGPKNPARFLAVSCISRTTRRFFG